MEGNLWFLLGDPNYSLPWKSPTAVLKEQQCAAVSAQLSAGISPLSQKEKYHLILYGCKVESSFTDLCRSTCVPTCAHLSSPFPFERILYKQ